jgi:UDP-N-acetylglucosamine:LPS N-acetylglucosamine transferase
LRILIFSASIGEGHDLPARVLAEGLEREAPGAEIEIVDSLEVVGWLTRRLVMDSSRFHSKWGSRLFDLSYRLITDIRPTRWFAGHLTQWLAARPIRKAVLERDPDIVISTYPGTTEVLGALRAKGKIDMPVVSAITDLAALRFWAHPGVDLHLITHPESAEEVRQIAPGTDVRCVRGLTDERFYSPRTQLEARSQLGLPSDGPVVLVSGGGWAVGDLEGAAEEALGIPGATIVCLCGRNDRLQAELAAHFGAEPRVRVEGFTDQMPDWFAAADVLVHSTAGLTVLEAIMEGCGVVSYGWGLGHVRVNNAAFVRFGLAEVAGSREELGDALVRALESSGAPDETFGRLPTAASAVLGLGLPDGELGDRGGARQEAGAHGNRH